MTADRQQSQQRERGATPHNILLAISYRVVHVVANAIKVDLQDWWREYVNSPVGLNRGPPRLCGLYARRVATEAAISRVTTGGEHLVPGSRSDVVTGRRGSGSSVGLLVSGDAP